jgi:ATP-binding cassette, subfamily B, beta-glucan exporter
MSLLHLYLRVLEMLGPERRLGLVLACANVLLAAAQFADPVLLGRIVDSLARNDTGPQPVSSNVTVLIGAWVGFGLFTIICGVMVALHADRIAHRRRQAAITDFFDHVLQLPLSFHTVSHSGRLMKVMLSGTDALWVLWLDFFRDSFAAGVSLLVLLPLSLFLNWQLGLLLIAVCFIFAFFTGLVISQTETLQRSVERHYSDLAERASDALGNVALVQGFARVEAEVSGLRDLADKLLSAQLPVLNWWAVVAVLTRASTTLTMLAILIAGVVLHSHGHASIGDIVMFMSFSASLIGQLEKFVRFVSKVFMDAPRLREFFNVLDTESSVRDRPDAIDPGRLRGLVEFKDVTLSYDGKRPAVADLTFTALPGDIVALVGSTGAGKSTALALLHRAFDPQSGTVMIDGVNVRDMKLSALRRNIGVVFQ